MHLCYKHASSGVLNMSKVKGSCERISGSMVQGFRGGLSVQTCHNPHVAMDYFFSLHFFSLLTLVPLSSYPFVLELDYHLFTHMC